MRWTRVLTALFMLAVGATSQAQTISIDAPSAARAGLRVGYGGHGVDWETSIDSPLLAGIGRFRADVGFGRWVGLGEVPPPAGSSPRVTRLAGTAILFIPSRESPELRGYIGLGVSAYKPYGVRLNRYTGTRVVLGMETSGDRWDVGPEIELDLPKATVDDLAGTTLVPAFRIGIAIRHRF
jgi:hypothetical protein